MNRCLNDVFGYCSGKPDAITSTQLETTRGLSGKIDTREVTVTHCRQDLDTCGFYQTFSQLLEQLHPNTV